MKKLLLLVVLALVGYGAWYFLSVRNRPKDETPRLQPVAVSKHSLAFNNNMKELLNGYYSLSEALVNWDSASISGKSGDLVKTLDGTNFDEMASDTAIHQTAVSYIDMLKGDLSTIQNEGNLEAKRRSFHSFSQNFFDLLRVVRYDASKIYLQECPMAFNDTEPGLWLSATEAIRNPYLGTRHPKYGKGMLVCGENKDVLDFTGAPAAEGKPSGAGQNP